jgi:hypothetical protein
LTSAWVTSPALRSTLRRAGEPAFYSTQPYAGRARTNAPRHRHVGLVVVCIQRQRRIAVQLELARDDHGVGGFALIVAAAEALTPVWLVELD